MVMDRYGRACCKANDAPNGIQLQVMTTHEAAGNTVERTSSYNALDWRATVGIVVGPRRVSRRGIFHTFLTFSWYPEDYTKGGGEGVGRGGNLHTKMMLF